MLCYHDNQFFTDALMHLLHQWPDKHIHNVDVAHLGFQEGQLCSDPVFQNNLHAAGFNLDSDFRDAIHWV
eukprot:1855524-Amphidinium_carterae.1